MSVEAAATSVLQEEVSDEVRATVFGLNDSVIVGAALVGSLLAPVSVELVGGGRRSAATAVGLALAAWWARPRLRHPLPGYRLGSADRRPMSDARAAAEGTPIPGGCSSCACSAHCC